MHRFGAWSCLLGVLALLDAPPPSVAAGPDGAAFFEQKIRPVLVKECYSCHSAGAEKLKGGLRLDSREGLLEGGDSGPAVVPGRPDESLLLDALRHDGIAMPPKSRLPDGVVADFERWIKLGAPDPRDGRPAPTRPRVDVEAGRRFWAYQPPRRHAPPAVADAGWPLSDVDRFILAALEARGIRPVPVADRATLIRRLSYDLVGLPPSPEEVDAFVADPAPDAYERLVDRLLASPHFGERWGRHWLDVARFAESVTLRGLVLKEAWRYRDYVIAAFNADVPFDRFVREQVAGDLLPAASVADRRRQIIATGFLALGNTNLEEQDKPQLRMDVVDEQLDVIGKAVLAQTIGCARCHDHKFDPIPTRDYYAMAGILRNARAMEHANVSKWIEMPLPAPPEQEEAFKKHEEAVAALEARIKAGRGRALFRGDTLALAGGEVAVGDLPGIVVDDPQAGRVGQWQETKSVPDHIGAGFIDDLGSGKGEKTLTFQAELPGAGEYGIWLAYPAIPDRATAVPVTILGDDGETTVEVDLVATPPIDGRFVPLGRYNLGRDGRGRVRISNEGTTGTVAADAVLFIPAGRAGPAAGGRSRDEGDPSLRALVAELKRLKAHGPKRDMAMTVVEGAEIGDTRVHIRGSAHNLGEEVPRGFLSVATRGDAPAMPSREGGRRELAGWLASRDNPLTARVAVNRAWHWLMGAGIVRTVDNFGTTGETPSHPELLDDLAVRFMEEDGWSVKALVRRIVTSRAYRLSSADDPRARAVDPENRLRWRMDRRRLDAECIRDAMLAVGGQLRPEMGGPTFPPTLTSDFRFEPGDDPRRSVYLPVFRNALPELFEAFDFADPSLVVGRRDASTVAPQALLLMNHPFVLEQARNAARRLLAEAGPDDAERVDRAYGLALGRPPTGAERRLGLSFVAEAGGTAAGPEEAWTIFFQALFASLEFRFVN